MTVTPHVELTHLEALEAESIHIIREVAAEFAAAAASAGWTVTSGLDIVKEVASVGTTDGGPDGTPRQPVFIESATVR